MIIPKFLETNDSIILVAPSFACGFDPYTTRLKMAIAKMERKGYKIISKKSNFVNKLSYASDTKEARAREINKAFKSDAKIVFSLGGGEVMDEILPLLNWNNIKKNPKWYVGYSDNTNLTFTLNTICDIASIYGECFPTLSMNPEHKSITDEINIIEGKQNEVSGYDYYEINSENRTINPTNLYNLSEKENISAINYVKPFEGIITGGCLDILITLCGTKFDKVKQFNKKYEREGIIWFLEACDLNSIQIKRALWQLKNAGWFKNTKGFIFGRPRIQDEAFGLTNKEVIMQELACFDVPIIFDAPIGHLPPSMPIISGAYTKVTYDGQIHLKYKI